VSFDVIFTKGENPPLPEMKTLDTQKLSTYRKRPKLPLKRLLDGYNCESETGHLLV